MKAKHLTLAAIALLFLGHAALADRQLDRAEILTIFGTLTGQPMTTWISTGTIRAAHEEYRAPETTSSAAINSQIQRAIQEYQNSDNRRALTEKLQKMELDAIPFNVRYRLSNEYTMTSMVVVEYDGSRFNWEINVQSRTDSVRPGPELAGNFMSDEFNLKWNRRRAFTWDGSKYTIYSRSANYAMVDATGSLPHVVNGPLTAGVVPWGYGAFSYANLSAAQSTADEKDANGQTQIHLTLRTSDGSDMLLVMDADRDYALISALTERADTTISTQYGNHRRVAGRWVPMTISIEQFDRWTNRMLAYDVWDFTSVSDRTPAIGSFSVAYEPDALIEYRSPVTDRPLTYRYSPMLDMDTLLTERLNFVASQGAQAQNCGTAALKYAASQLGKDATDRQLARLIDGANGGTSLQAMRDTARSLGLYARAVRTDMEGLKNLSGCQAILHIPGKNHYVVLGDIDSHHVWCVDLANDRFCYRADIHFFGMDWTEGTVLLVSDRPITGGFNDIADGQLKAIRGGDGYTCTDLLQEYDVIYCSGWCEGCYTYYPTRYGCEAAPSGMCMESEMLRSAESPCTIDSIWFDCTVTGDFTCYYMSACS